jgi:omega-6 fatty acid desaturase (delta-12 desaturase)
MEIGCPVLPTISCTLWASDADWSFATSSLRGSSHLQLPRILQWFTGNIGFHHVHHLNPRIPNYRLEACHRMIGGLQLAPVLTLRTALVTPRYALWDEVLGRMVRFPSRRSGEAPP